MNRFSSEAIGTRIEAAVRFLAPFAAFVYCLGFTLGAWVHSLNDKLTQALRPAPAPAPKAAPAVHPLSLIADSLESLPAKSLRTLAGIRSKRPRKSELAALLVAC